MYHGGTTDQSVQIQTGRSRIKIFFNPVILTKKNNKKQPFREYARYSGMAAEMFVLLLVMVLLGRYIDQKMANPKNYVTAVLVLLGLGGYLYKLYLQVSKNGKK